MLNHPKNPFEIFATWLEEAKQHPEIIEPTAMSLATVSNNQPSVRIVLLKDYDERGFVFYSNSASQKGQELAQNPNVALCFYWEKLEKQVRIQGQAEQVNEATADNFASRTREKQIGAWASLQSQPMSGRAEFEQRITEITANYQGLEVPRPPHWVGWRVRPQTIEFWQQQNHRWHHRERFVRQGNDWQMELLYP
jgi:pyridoxamine 5'-phosphate oxidase